MLPAIRGLTEAGYLTNESVFDLTALPASLVVIGGGPLGCELAQVFCRFGARTVIVHDEPLFLPKEERDAAQMVSEALARDGVEIHLNTTAVNVHMENGKKCVETVNDGNVATIKVDQILTGIGRFPAVGGLNLEAAGVAFDADAGIHVDDFPAHYQPSHLRRGGCLSRAPVHRQRPRLGPDRRAERALSRPQESQRLDDPWCTYPDPEIAHVGIYVKQARERGIPVKTFTVPMHDNDRAIADGEEDGFVKIHVREGTDEILGATIVARHAWRNDQRHLAGDVRRHRPAHGRARDPHLSEAGRSDPASRHRLHALAADALRRLGTAQMGRSLSALVAHAGKHQPPTTESTHDLRAALQRRVLDLPAVLERAGTKAAVF